ncbi:MAG: DUF1566 domain-containing protein [Deltaproteobacteria bacterium]|nr:DUF1566 domain-containing protein [Deltaproteobacteria bacterium]
MTITGTGECDANTGVTMLTARSGAQYTHANAVDYCRDLTDDCAYVIDGTCDATNYTDWRLSTVEELALFEGITSDTSWLWTMTRSTLLGAWIEMKLSNGDWGNENNYSSNYVRCVR